MGGCVQSGCCKSDSSGSALGDWHFLRPKITKTQVSPAEEPRYPLQASCSPDTTHALQSDAYPFQTAPTSRSWLLQHLQSETRHVAPPPPPQPRKLMKGLLGTCATTPLSHPHGDILGGTPRPALTVSTRGWGVGLGEIFPSAWVTAARRCHSPCAVPRSAGRVQLSERPAGISARR